MTSKHCSMLGALGRVVSIEACRHDDDGDDDGDDDDDDDLHLYSAVTPCYCICAKRATKSRGRSRDNWIKHHPGVI